MTFPDQLKAHRQRLSLTQVEAAAALDVKPRTYWEWEAGKTAPLIIAQEGALARLKKMKPK